jgi:replicative DNA helicase
MGKPQTIYRTGLPRLDRALAGGLFPKRVYGLVSRWKSGKTALGGTISFNLNYAGVRHLYVCCEMGDSQIEERQIARGIGCNANDLTDSAKRADPAFRKRVADYAVMSPDDVLYRNMPGCTFDALRSEVEQAVLADRITGFILDYLQLVRGKPDRVTTAEHLDTVSQWIAEICKRRNIWAIVLGQLNQTGGTRGGEGPLLAFDWVAEICKPNEDMDATLSPDSMWLQTLCTRYTEGYAIGTSAKPAYRLNTSVGPYFEELENG